MAEERRARHRVGDVSADERMPIPVLPTRKRNGIRFRRDSRARPSEQNVDDVPDSGAGEMARCAAEASVSQSCVVGEATGGIERARYGKDVLTTAELVQ